MTLIELLIVIIILTTIVAAAIPIMAPADGDRANREATRSLNTFITSAQARAIASNRLYGIGLKRLSQDTGRPEDRGVCVQVYYVEQQPPYAGFDTNARARVSFYTPSHSNAYGGASGLVLIQFVRRESGGGVPNSVDSLPVGFDVDELPGVRNASAIGGTIRPGDVIEINSTRYQLLADGSDDNISTRLDSSKTYFRFDTGSVGNGKPTQVVAVPLNGTGQMLNVTHDEYGAEVFNPTVGKTHNHFFTFPSPYKILRQPVTTADEPFQMPEGTAIDLRASGLGHSDLHYFYWPDDVPSASSDPRVHDNNDPIMILFSPEGKVDRIRYTQGSLDLSTLRVFEQPVTDDLYLLVGRRGAIPAPTLDRDVSLDQAKWDALKTDDDRLRAREPVNWLTGTSRWILIGSQSGRIATIPISSVDPSLLMAGPNPMAQRSEDLRAQQILASREFTRGTTRETGR